MSVFPPTEEPSSTSQRKCVIEIGSGVTRINIADVTQKDQRWSIQKIVHQEKKAILHAQDAAKHGNLLSESIYQQTLEVLSNYQTTAKSLGVEKIHAVATDIFRKADNGSTFIDRLNQELGLNIEIIDQHIEGKIGFLSIAHATSQISHPISVDLLVAWDAGNSSSQVSTLDPDGSLIVYKSPFGFAGIQMAWEEIRSKQAEKSKTDPISLEEIEALLTHIKDRLPEVPDPLAKALSSKTVVREIGSNWILNLFGIDHGMPISKSQVHYKLHQCIGKSDEELSKLFPLDHYSAKDVALSLLGAYVIMDKLGIFEVLPVQVENGNTCGILLSF
jgi:exopolyphosphatase/pppGpp-phosphohydrolase